MPVTKNHDSNTILVYITNCVFAESGEEAHVTKSPISTGANNSQTMQWLQAIENFTKKAQ